MSTLADRRRMAVAIVNFEARRDAKGHLVVYNLPKGDGGGKYEVAGINERYNKQTVDALVALLDAKRYDEAEALATEFIAQETDRATAWTGIPSVEFYLRDCVFNRGAGGAASILQRAVGASVDGAVGKVTLDAARVAERDVPSYLQRLRQAREQYEREVVKRNETSKFWKGLVNRWNNALVVARTFSSDSSASSLQSFQTFLSESTAATPDTNPVLPALRVGSSGSRVDAWQAFLAGQHFDPGGVDGFFGEATRQATILFQQANGLKVDGVAGRETILKATSLGFELIEEPADDKTGSNYPRPPGFPVLSDAQRAAIFSTFDYVPAPIHDNPEAIRILGSWEVDNIAAVPIPQLRKQLGPSAPKTVRFHKLASKQLQALWSEWEGLGLLDRILTFEGGFNPRFVRGSRTNLSNHSFGTAFDVNYEWNPLGARPALVGEKGCVRELVEAANKHGFYWGGHYRTRLDGNHFEVAFVVS